MKALSGGLEGYGMHQHSALHITPRTQENACHVAYSLDFIKSVAAAGGIYIFFV